MNCVHDLGSMDGLGAVDAEANEPVFRHLWERIVSAPVSATSAQRRTNEHAFRHLAAHASGRCDQYAYNVRFDAHHFWGDVADQRRSALLVAGCDQGACR